MMTLNSIKSMLAGAGGSLVLALFCSTFIALEKVLFILPLFIAFNGCLTGFRLVEVMRDKMENRGVFSFIMGIGSGAAVFSVVNMAGRMINNPFGLTFTDLFLYLTVSGVTSCLGAWLAVRYFKL